MRHARRTGYGPLFALSSLLALSAVPSETHAAIIFDDFDDDIVDSRYTALGGASLAESGGEMTVSMPSTNDGLSIVHPELTDVFCYQFEFEPSGFTTGERLEFEVIQNHPVAGDFVALRVSKQQTGSSTVTIESFDKDGNTIETEEFPFSVDVVGEWLLRIDLVDGEWVVDLRKGIPEDLVDELVEAATGSNAGKATRIEITVKSDGTLALKSLRLDEFHTPIPTVSEWGLIVITLLLLTAGTVVIGRRRRPATA